MGETYINHWAVLVAAISDMLVGAIWYSPALFYKAWLKENGFTEEIVKKGNPAVIYGLTFVLSLVISYNLAFFLGDAQTDAMWGVTAGFLAGFGFSLSAFIIVGLFERRSFNYLAINSGYIIKAFVLKGLIIGAWR